MMPETLSEWRDTGIGYEATQGLYQCLIVGKDDYWHVICHLRGGATPLWKGDYSTLAAAQAAGEIQLDRLANPHQEPLAGTALWKAVEEQVLRRERPGYLWPDCEVSLSLAWRLVEVLGSRGWRVSVSQSQKGRWRASFDTGTNTRRAGEWGASAPEAICRAALAVVALEAHEREEAAAVLARRGA